MRKVAAIVLIALIAAIGIAGAIGLATPREHTASAAAEFHSPPADIWAALAAPADFPSWRDSVERVELLPPDPATGQARWREYGRFGPMTMEQVRAQAPQLLVVRIADSDQGYSGSWTYEIRPTNGGSHVRITERGEVANPLFRFFARYVAGYHGTMLGELRSMGERFGPVGEPYRAPTPGPDQLELQFGQ